MSCPGLIIQEFRPEVPGPTKFYEWAWLIDALFYITTAVIPLKCHLKNGSNINILYKKKQQYQFPWNVIIQKVLNNSNNSSEMSLYKKK